VPVHVIERMMAAFEQPGANIHTPYGATESLPIASISGREVLDETAVRSQSGAGTCVGHLFPHVRVRIIEITEGPIATISETRELSAGDIGEIVVQAPSTTREYFRLPEATTAAKIADGRPQQVTDVEDRSHDCPPPPALRPPPFWHRMGDVGWMDESGRLWFCGRKAHIVEANGHRMFTIPCEAIFNAHGRVFRSALVGVGPTPTQRPVIVVEPEPAAFPETESDQRTFRAELLELGRANPLTENIATVLFHRSLPVDIRHNVKIFREKLGPWAEQQLTSSE